VTPNKVAEKPGILRVSDGKSRGPAPFGHALRARRLEKKIGLREFAKLVGISPTYLSQVEQCNIDPPTAERVGRMADLLAENSDEWLAMAGHIPNDLSEIFRHRPSEISELLREARGLTGEQLRHVIEQIRLLKVGQPH
jgi:HTH-type transcriptional regulator, competence development regulator